MARVWPVMTPLSLASASVLVTCLLLNAPEEMPSLALGSQEGFL